MENVFRHHFLKSSPLNLRNRPSFLISRTIFYNFEITELVEFSCCEIVLKTRIITLKIGSENIKIVLIC